MSLKKKGFARFPEGQRQRQTRPNRSSFQLEFLGRLGGTTRRFCCVGAGNRQILARRGIVTRRSVGGFAMERRRCAVVVGSSRGRRSLSSTASRSRKGGHCSGFPSQRRTRLCVRDDRPPRPPSNFIIVYLFPLGTVAPPGGLLRDAPPRGLGEFY